MKMHLRRIGLAALSGFATIALSLWSTPAFAAFPEGTNDVAVILQQHPGGEEVAPGVISWSDGAIVMTLAGAASPAAIGSCATGQYCAWSGTSYTGTKLAFSACSASGTSSSLSLLGGTVRSTANARSSGHVNAQNGSTTVYTMAANTGHPSNSNNLTSLVCFS